MIYMRNWYFKQYSTGYQLTLYKPYTFKNTNNMTLIPSPASPASSRLQITCSRGHGRGSSITWVIKHSWSLLHSVSSGTHRDSTPCRIRCGASWSLLHSVRSGTHGYTTIRPPGNSSTPSPLYLRHIVPPTTRPLLLERRRPTTTCPCVDQIIDIFRSDA